MRCGSHPLSVNVGVVPMIVKGLDYRLKLKVLTVVHGVKVGEHTVTE